MSIQGIFFVIILTIIVVGWVIWPFLRPPQPDDARHRALARQRERVLLYYERVLANIRDLDEDLATAKISPEEHAQERAMWAERGVQLLQLLDELAAQHSLDQDELADDAAIDAVIESRIAVYRQQQTAS